MKPLDDAGSNQGANSLWLLALWTTAVVLWGLYVYLWLDIKRVYLGARSHEVAVCLGPLCFGAVIAVAEFVSRIRIFGWKAVALFMIYCGTLSAITVYLVARDQIGA